MGSITLYARADTDSKGDIVWTLDDKKNGKKGERKKVDLPKDSGEWSFKIRLDDDTPYGLKFDPSDPIWIAETNNCPPPPGINTDQIYDVDVNGQKTLTFRDRNCGDAVDLKYQLNFLTSDNQRAEPLDPDIRNGGGGNPPLMGQTQLLAIVGVALIGFAVALWFNR